MKITYDGDYGNSPRVQYIYSFNVAFAKAEIETILDMLSEDAIWNMVGYKKIKGRNKIKEELVQMKLDAVENLVIENLLSHGKLGAVNGQMLYANGKVIAFSDVYEFSNHSKTAKISRLDSYGIDLSSK